MRKLICKTGRWAGREIDLADGLLRVGRNPENEIQIEEPSISSFHCELHVADIGIGVRDLGSTNGTFINQKQIARGVVHTGDVLTLGEIDFAVQLPEVRVALPEIEQFEPPGAAFLLDGSPACFNHSESAALFRCTKCETWWCGQCVRSLKRLSGEFLQFCPECSAPCESMVVEKAAKKGFLSRVSETIRLTRKK
jgi:pSer/pThr/pTyr-binding forkhead associated (FHA) protein